MIDWLQSPLQVVNPPNYLLTLWLHSLTLMLHDAKKSPKMELFRATILTNQRLCMPCCPNRAVQVSLPINWFMLLKKRSRLHETGSRDTLNTHTCNMMNLITIVPVGRLLTYGQVVGPWTNIMLVAVGQPGLP